MKFSILYATSKMFGKAGQFYLVHLYHFLHCYAAKKNMFNNPRCTFYENIITILLFLPLMWTSWAAVIINIHILCGPQNIGPWYIWIFIEKFGNLFSHTIQFNHLIITHNKKMMQHYCVIYLCNIFRFVSIQKCIYLHIFFDKTSLEVRQSTSHILNTNKFTHERE